MITVGLVDDHPAYLIGLRSALAALPDVTVAWMTTSVAEALENLGKAPVNVVVMDIQYGRSMAGLDAVRAIRKRWRGVVVVAISALADPLVVDSALAAGAACFIAKHTTVRDMLHQLESTIRDHRGLSSQPAPNPVAKTLTRRELEVLEGIRKGHINREIAAALGISTATVNKHVESVLRKLQARNRAHAASLI